MIVCGHCGIHFSASLRHCPKCQQFEAPHSAVVERLKIDAKARLEMGAERAEMQSLLIEYGVPRSQAVEFVNENSEKIDRGVVNRGALWLLIGCLAIPLGLCPMALAVDWFFAPFRHAGSLAFGFELYFSLAWFSAGGVIVFFGLKAVRRGLKAIFFAREENNFLKERSRD
jgi:hypothetical protein